ncbi:MAG: creatininase family protein, partial [Thermomicrobiales bacterium]|nr:creatininase family protein [Thermomicrobiales bacterium]
PILFNELTRTQLRALAPDSLVVLPVGATEQHGPHLVTGTDTFAIEHIARAAAVRAADAGSIVVAPTLPYGSSDHHLVFGGTLSFSTQTYYAVIRDLVTSLITDGFGKMLIVNGHGGNHEIIQLVARDLALTHPVQIGALSYWQPAQDRLDAVWSGTPAQRPPGHAGEFETSLVLHLRPDLPPVDPPSRTDVEIAALPKSGRGWRLERNDGWTGMNGFTDNPAAATAESGERFLEIAVDALAGVMREFLAT